MCGIIGIISLTSIDFDIYKLLHSIEHRGPDSYGIFVENNVFLGHKRLSIIDTSAKSSQPMHFNNYVIVFNGAIYNYQEIRKELEEKGYTFFSGGDTEVILKAFDYWGKDCVKKFNGMFAFAILDKNEQKLFLARDRFGVKPLYFSLDSSGFKFSSTLPSLLNFPGTDKTINPKALHNYMTLHSIVPPPDTIINGIKKLPQASVMEYNLKTNQVKIEPYWEYTGKNSGISGYDAIKEELLHKLKKSVKRRLVADVEVGVLLSGGIDSTLLVSFIKDSQPDLKTYSIGFESTIEEKGDEFYFSDLVAKRFQTNHHKILIDKSRMLKAIPNVIRAMSEPMISHDAIGFYLLSQEVSRTIKVVQTGQGADEIFAGYHWYPKIAEAKGNLADSYSNFFFERDHNELKELINPEFITEDFSSKFIENYFSKLKNFSDMDKVLHIDSNIMLVDDPVKRVDNMTMAWGLEARLPFLDHELVEFAASIPAVDKYSGGGKLILRDMARNIIPDEIIDRPKAYFPVPALRYIKADFLELIKEVIDSHISRKRGIFKRNFLNKILDQPNSNITKLGTNPLWQIAVLEMWLQANNL
jgi:asparagine synthase (glutamine-hydrolysing)